VQLKNINVSSQVTETSHAHAHTKASCAARPGDICIRRPRSLKARDADCARAVNTIHL